ncbi:hypothetical protein M378DRAFT_389816 [Amanita muscaria Koide BX008]|uniref:Uncharacterized protein n=1 Tax=Amanita muscaria (strain Koide BX008) TaxID=946122 RepID=A0A0C2WXB7_AMAMK|nr:hypothetical protein M378DRAFT_389816 [Amanita muscaria Koide BX008]
MTSGFPGEWKNVEVCEKRVSIPSHGFGFPPSRSTCMDSAAVLALQGFAYALVLISYQCHGPRSITFFFDATSHDSTITSANLSVQVK